MLHKLLAGMDGSRFQNLVISLSDCGTIGPRIEALGVPVCSLNLDHTLGSLFPALRFPKILRQFRPSLIQGWMYHGNLAALLGSVLVPGRPPAIWNVRQSMSSLDDEKPMTARVIRLGAHFSGRADAIIYNSTVSARQHEAIGFSPEHRQILPNGFDCDEFSPDPAARAAFRQALGIAPNALVVGLAARFHPMKDHALFLAAAAKSMSFGFPLHFILAGKDVDDGNPAIAAMLDRHGLRGRVTLLGEVERMSNFFNALDLETLCSSRGEGFPNVVGEAMACGIPCVVSDIGDSADIVGDTGVVIPPSSVDALVAGWHTLLAEGNERIHERGSMARARVMARYSLRQIVAEYESLYLRASN
jgi:glycosyltransferase involved in cell wall biosynthesis